MKPLESKLEDVFVKKFPYALPENFKKGLVSALPWVAVLVGALSLLGALGAFQLMSWSGALTTYAGYAPNYGIAIWFSLALLVAEAVLSFMAFSPLRAKAKRGWDLMFWLALLNVVYTVAYLIITPNLAQFLLSLIGSAFGLYLLFQIRSYYTGASKA
jgi:hypothetical protein